MDNSKPMTFGFPCKCNNLIILVLKFKDFDGDITFLDSEELKTSVGALLCLGITINL